MSILENARDLGNEIYDKSEVEAKIAELALARDNTDVYTPTEDYHPATKEYVDNNGGGGNPGGSLDISGNFGFEGTSALTDLVSATGFISKTYTGNGSSQNIDTGISSVDFTDVNNGSGYRLLGSYTHNGGIVLPDNPLEDDSRVQPSSSNGIYLYVGDISKYKIGDRLWVHNKSDSNSYVICATVIELGSDNVGLSSSFSRTTDDYAIFIQPEPRVLAINTSRVQTKQRNEVGNYHVVDGLRGSDLTIFSNLFNATSNQVDSIDFPGNGVEVGANLGINKNGITYVMWQTLYTHITWGNADGSWYVEAFNPVTGAGMRVRDGVDTAVAMPHSLGSEIKYSETKRIDAHSNGQVFFGKKNRFFQLYSPNGINPDDGTTLYWDNRDPTNKEFYFGGGASVVNSSNAVYVDYYYAESKAISTSNYRIGEYTGSGSANLKINIGVKPAYIVIKRIDLLGSWMVYDLPRTGDNWLRWDATSSEINTVGSNDISFNTDGFTLLTSDTYTNAANGKYFYMVIYDNDNGSGRSKFDNYSDDTKLDLDGTFNYVTGKEGDIYSKSSSAFDAEVSFTGISGTRFIARDSDGEFLTFANEPTIGRSTDTLVGDQVVLDTEDGKMYNSSGELDKPLSFFKYGIVFSSGIPTYIDTSKELSTEALGVLELVGDVEITGTLTNMAVPTAIGNIDGRSIGDGITDGFGFVNVVRSGTGQYVVTGDGTIDFTKAIILVNCISSSGVLSTAEVLTNNSFGVFSRASSSNALTDHKISVVVFGGK